MSLPEAIEERTITKSKIHTSWSERILVLFLLLATFPLLTLPLLLFRKRLRNTRPGAQGMANV
mgnify:CR=1 FL=1